jgi:hypothetical protein
MPTKEQYESGAQNLIERIKQSEAYATKARIMTALGNLRLSQYQHTLEPRAKRLAGNCYIAARYFGLRAKLP